jgi:predicted nuclease of restriction endonuclease-like (RecB) superfamily
MSKLLKIQPVVGKFDGYDNLVAIIQDSIDSSRKKIAKTINSSLIDAYWSVGKYIVEFEQNGAHFAKYGDDLLGKLSKDLTLRLGSGFSRSNLHYMRNFYIYFPNTVTLSHDLSWSHYYEILKISDELERQFYYNQTIKDNWSVRELRRQKNSGLFLRLALSKNKKEILELSKTGHNVTKPEDAIKDTYVLEFLNLLQAKPLEAEIEAELIDKLQHFLLELGKGFAFIGRQYRITTDNTHYYVDLVFYHVVLKCYVLIDLKRGDAKHEDIGQMNMYLGYFAMDKNTETDNPPIGIVLAASKDDVMVKYATYGMDSQLFVSKYQLYLPDLEELREIVAKQLEEDKESRNCG